MATEAEMNSQAADAAILERFGPAIDPSNPVSSAAAAASEESGKFEPSKVSVPDPAGAGSAAAQAHKDTKSYQIPQVPTSAHSASAASLAKDIKAPPGWKAPKSQSAGAAASAGYARSNTLSKTEAKPSGSMSRSLTAASIAASSQSRANTITESSRGNGALRAATMVSNKAQPSDTGLLKAAKRQTDADLREMAEYTHIEPQDEELAKSATRYSLYDFGKPETLRAAVLSMDKARQEPSGLARAASVKSLSGSRAAVASTRGRSGSSASIYSPGTTTVSPVELERAALKSLAKSLSNPAPTGSLPTDMTTNGAGVAYRRGSNRATTEAEKLRLEAEKRAKIEAEMNSFVQKLPGSETSKLMVQAQKNMERELNLIQANIKHKDQHKFSQYELDYAIDLAKERQERDSGNIRLGPGKYMSYEEIERIAGNHVQPVLEEIAAQAEEDRRRREQEAIEKEEARRKKEQDEREEAERRAEEKKRLHQENEVKAAERNRKYDEEIKAKMAAKAEKDKLKAEQKAEKQRLKEEKRVRDEEERVERNRRREEERQKRAEEKRLREEERAEQKRLKEEERTRLAAIAAQDRAARAEETQQTEPSSEATATGTGRGLSAGALFATLSSRFEGGTKYLKPGEQKDSEIATGDPIVEEEAAPTRQSHETSTSLSTGAAPSEGVRESSDSTSNSGEEVESSDAESASEITTVQNVDTATGVEPTTSNEVNSVGASTGTATAATEIPKNQEESSADDSAQSPADHNEEPQTLAAASLGAGALVGGAATAVALNKPGTPDKKSKRNSFGWFKKSLGKIKGKMENIKPEEKQKSPTLAKESGTASVSETPEVADAPEETTSIDAADVKGKAKELASSEVNGTSSYSKPLSVVPLAPVRLKASSVMLDKEAADQAETEPKEITLTEALGIPADETNTDELKNIQENIGDVPHDESAEEEAEKEADTANVVADEPTTNGEIDSTAQPASASAEDDVVKEDSGATVDDAVSESLETKKEGLDTIAAEPVPDQEKLEATEEPQPAISEVVAPKTEAVSTPEPASDLAPEASEPVSTEAHQEADKDAPARTERGGVFHEDL